MHEVLLPAAQRAHFGREGALERAAEAEQAYAAGRAAVVECEATPPGPDLVSKVLAARELPLDTASRIALYACWERMAAWVAAEQMAELSAVAGGRRDHESDGWIATDAALATGLSEHTLAGRLCATRRTGDALPETWQALHAGRITSAHHWVVDQVLREATAEVARQVEAVVVPKAVANGWTPAQLRDATRYLLARLDPDGAEDRARRARRERANVRLRAEEDMLASLIATGDPATLTAMYAEINARADVLRRAGDERPLGELRVAAMAALVFGDDPVPHTGRATPSPARRTGPPEVLVVMALSTLLGGSEPAELAGYGPITPAMARRIAADATLRRLVCDPVSGRPVDLGRTRYRASRQLRDWLVARDRTCRFPGCRRPAHYCQVDHADEYAAGGATSCANCGLLCQRHHTYKTRKAWDLVRLPGDVTRWTSPHGFVWDAPAATYPMAANDAWPRAG